MKRTLFICLAVLGISVLRPAVAEIFQQKVELYAGDIPNAIRTDNPGVVHDERFNDQFVIGISKPSLTAYLPEGKDKASSAVVICPGGGYFGVSAIKEGQEVAERFAENGIAAFVLHYRMPSPETMNNPDTGPLQDLQQALAVVKSRAEKWHINPDHIGVMGFSAGGHLAATAATHYQKPVLSSLTTELVTPDFQILVYPVISMQSGITHQGSRDLLLGNPALEARVDAFSNEKRVSGDTAPAYIVHANDDQAVVVDNALEYYNALRAHDVSVQMLLLQEGGHGFGMRHPVDWFDGVLQWVTARSN
ncbi:alpha/beta hydrolase [Alteromonas gilva]|uniref:Alpha/beta hydrolase n=1 Tax=Alteromonas gilva TaxID=2987522 RepID=A0ABT5L3C7_9ALTE|nr:alpha/beta hydrolase [Alteromonas gilva]MDC8830288.1 alpha/beta hydrolase [Alteromonas gilva]